MYSFSEIVNSNVKYEIKNGVYKIIKEPFTSQLNDFLKGYYDNAPNYKYTTDYKKLPFVFPEVHGAEWKFRRASLNIAQRFIQNGTYTSFLEIGPWNGWLTHHLSKIMSKGVAVDLFDDDINGLQIIRHYENPKWIPIQCDVEELDFFKVKFDLIILNHCAQFFNNRTAAITQLKSLLNKGGAILILGSTVFTDASEKRLEVEEQQRTYFERTGKNLYFRPTKGYFDGTDKEELEHTGFKFYRYNLFYKNLVLSYFNKKRAKVYYAIFTNE